MCFDICSFLSAIYIRHSHLPFTSAMYNFLFSAPLPESSIPPFSPLGDLWKQFKPSGHILLKHLGRIILLARSPELLPICSAIPADGILEIAGVVEVHPLVVKALCLGGVDDLLVERLGCGRDLGVIGRSVPGGGDEAEDQGTGGWV